MAETDVHRAEMNAAIEALADHFRNAPDIYVAGNLLLYYEEGNPAASVAPDTFVVKGVAKHLRRTYKLWEEGKGPEAVIEFTSRSTRFEDQGNKRALYAWMGVKEYFLFDPLDEYLDPPLQGHRLVDRDYQRMQPGPDGALVSDALGLLLTREGTHLRLRDRVTGEPLLTPLEAQARRREAEARLELERREAEARLELERREAEARLELERREAEARLEQERGLAHRLAVRSCELVLKLRWPALLEPRPPLERLETGALEALAESLSAATDEPAARAILEAAATPAP